VYAKSSVNGITKLTVVVLIVSVGGERRGGCMVLGTCVGGYCAGIGFCVMIG
jgi:hypothetical protein